MAGVLPFLVAAVAVGLGRLSSTGRLRGAILVLTLSTVSAVMIGPWPGAVAGQPTFYRTDRSPEFLASLRSAVELVPDAAPGSATNRSGAPHAPRRYLYSAPVLGRAEWVVLDMGDPWVPRAWGGGNDPEAIEAFRLRLERSSDWQLVLEEGNVVVYRKAPS